MDAVIGLVVIGLAVWGLVAIVRAIARRHSAQRDPAGSRNPPIPPGPPTDDSVPAFDILALGGSGAGKTVLVSSIFHALNYTDRDRSYYLDTDAADRVRLGALYATVADPSQPWPRGTATSESHRYTFTCIARDPQGRKRPVLRLNYLDFAGRLLEGVDTDRPAFHQLDEAVRRASALLILLDGRQVRGLLRRDPAAHDYFEHRIRAIIGYAQNATCPIHFVVTKWDLIQTWSALGRMDDAGRLRTVQNALVQFGHLRALLQDHTPGQIVRLIPVSAVGASFVDADDAGISHKRVDGEVRPTNIEVPVAVVLPDVFRQVEAALDRKTHDELAMRLRQRKLGAAEMVTGAVARLSTPAMVTVRQTLFAMAGGPAAALSDGLLGAFVQWFAERHRTSPAAAAHTEEITGEFDLVRILRDRVMHDFTRAVGRYEARYEALTDQDLR